MFLPVALVLSVLAEMSHARPIENWSYEKLLRSADLVVVARTLTVVDAGNQIDEKPPDRDFVGVLTSFDVSATLKGRVTDKKIVLFHYRLKDGVVEHNGPLLASFHAQKMRIDTGVTVRLLDPPEYMLFLKKRADGR